MGQSSHVPGVSAVGRCALVPSPVHENGIASHSALLTAASFLVTSPSPHLLHFSSVVAPCLSLYLPRGHFLQSTLEDLAVSSLYVPLGQSLRVPTWQNDPVGHVSQASSNDFAPTVCEALILRLYVPGMQRSEHCRKCWGSLRCQARATKTYHSRG